MHQTAVNTLLNRIIKPYLSEQDWALLEPVINVLHEASQAGHSCLPISEIEASGSWRERLLALAGSNRSIGKNANDIAPLIVENDYFYWQQNAKREQIIATQIGQRTKALTLDDAELAAIDRLFSDAPENASQKQAAHVALSNQFSVILGGPGTGKTTTVAKLLSALVESHSHKAHFNIQLVAPTGKAAARLAESMRNAVTHLDIEERVRQQLPTEAQTIHRLIGSGRGKPKYHIKNPLLLDAVVVDEASMIDMKLMTQLLEALPRHARVLLLGDPDQLASVEAGSVLADISAASSGLLASSVAKLTYSFRFAGESGIGSLAHAVNAGKDNQAQALLASELDDIHWIEALDIEALASPYLDYLSTLRDGSRSEQVIDAFNRWRVLSALRDGDYGVDGLNHAIEGYLAALADGLEPNSEFYHGRPIMVTENDHQSRLYNGDIGIVLENDSGKFAYFEDEGGSTRAVAVTRLPEVETAFAMTVHKSQGSEFSGCALVLPPALNANNTNLLTRELLYTGLTRAKQRFLYLGTKKALSHCINNETQRFSGLITRLGQLT